METKNTDSYKKLEVETADPLSLVIMLYDRAIFLLDKAKNEIEEKEYEEKNHSLNKATDIVLELLATLDEDKGGEIASTLAQLYNFVLREINDANVNLNLKALETAKRIMSELKESWVSIKDNPETEINNANHTITRIDLSG